MNFEKVMIIFLAFVSLVGGLNWLVTALRNMSDDTTTNDIFYDWIDQKWVNWIYILVFICTLVLFIMLLFPGSLNIGGTKSLSYGRM
jgi:hypothetical protein